MALSAGRSWCGECATTRWSGGFTLLVKSINGIEELRLLVKRGK